MREAAVDLVDVALSADDMCAPAERGSERFALIVAAADAMLDEHGLDGLTIRAVLQRTGLARRAFYECFSGKDDLMLAVFAHVIRGASEWFRTQFALLPTPLERLRLVVGSITGPPRDTHSGWERERRSAALSIEHLRLAEARPDDLRRALGPLVTVIAEQIEAGTADGSMRACDPNMTARLIYNLASNTAHDSFIRQPDDMSERRRTSIDIWEFCRRAIAA